MSARPAECRCDYNFTCSFCLSRAAERNAADRNNAPLSWAEESKKRRKRAQAHYINERGHTNSQ